ncbi:hypothetical protein KKH26_00805 [Patescibacteria group bacterium]|nr:hypothetical protein [Patescibacteria group bacterium]
MSHSHSENNPEKRGEYYDNDGNIMGTEIQTSHQKKKKQSPPKNYWRHALLVA